MAVLSQTKLKVTARGLLMKRFVVSIVIFVFAFASGVQAQESRRFTIEEMMKVRRVADPRVSPDGQQVVFIIGDVDFAGSRVVNQIYVMPLAAGAEIKRLTTGDKSSS